ncbi:spore gernimation protein GerD [Bacillaceae bacterium Marseille-Q3522]|nr:spore gernimation protein GerD [Bacillaceae bacterium Marseille-Q3522]
MKKFAILLPLLSLFLLTSCNQDDTGGNVDYEQTKKMTVDILKTDEGKKAIQEILADEQMKQQLIMDQAIVSNTIASTLTSEAGTEFWKKSFEDPKFAEAMATGMKTENEELLKSLMKDPDYQKMMLDLLKDPDFEKVISDTLKSQEYRKHLQEVITETFESPLFKAKLQDVLLKAASEIQKGGGQQGGQGGQDTEGGGDGEQGGQ